ncbi:unnamed protein product, partial [Prorocentrum cordatum]
QLRELNLVKALIPLAGVDLGAPSHPWAYCSDASLWGYAVATSRFDPDELMDIGACRERWRFLAVDRYADDPGGPPGFEVAVQAGFAAGAADDSLIAGMGQPPPGRGAPRRRRPARIEVEAAAAAAGGSAVPALPDSALAAHRWQLVVRGAFLFPAPIHVLEGRTTLLGLRRATRSVAAHGCRVLSIGDNLSSMMAFEKGRCANPVLRQLACQSAARQLATGIQRYHRYSESKRNPTDHDSRAAARAWHDLTDRNVMRVIRSLIVRREVWYVHLGTPCAPFSQATPAQAQAKHLASGAGAVSFTVDLLRLCDRFGVKWSLENPSSSRLWQRSEVTAFLERHCHYFVNVQYCQYNCRYLKPTTLVTNLRPLQALSHREWQPGQLDWGSSIAQARAAERDRRRRFSQVGFSGGAGQLAAEQRVAHSEVARSDFLARRRVKPLTQQHYGRAAAEVRRFAERHHYPQTTAAQRDQLMVGYLQGIFVAGGGYAFEERIDLRGASEFPQARLTLRGFSRAAPGEQRGPCPWEAALLMVDQYLGSSCPRQRLVGVAVAGAFDGYLRLPVLLSVKACDVTCLQHSATSACPQVSISLMLAAPPDCPPSATTKSGESDDAVIAGGSAAAAALRRWVARLIRDLKRAKPATWPLFPFTAREFQAALRQAGDAAGLQRLRLGPHALRHGGASVDYALQDRSPAEVQRHGRWKCAASVSRYEKAGRLTRQLAKFSSAQLSATSLVGERLAAKASFDFGRSVTR